MPFILGVRVDAVKKIEAEVRLRSFLHVPGFHKVFTPNAEILLEAHRSAPFKEVLNQGDLNLVDGVSLVLVSKIIRLNNNSVQEIENRVTGVEALEMLCKMAAEERKKILFLGAGLGIAEKAANSVKKRYPQIEVQSFYPGKIEEKEGRWSFEFGSIDDIQNLKPDILVVALGHGKQEHFICSTQGELPSVKIAIGVGGALDYLSGYVKRAPALMRSLGLEWLYRLIHQPQRIGRIFNAVVVFPLTVLWSTMRGNYER